MSDITDAARRLDAAVEAMKSLEGDARDIAEEYALAAEQLNREALVALVRRLRQDEAGKALLNGALDDELIRMLFAMYGIIRVPEMPAGVKVANLLANQGCCGGGGSDCGCH